jgi:hypothetical protein
MLTLNYLQIFHRQLWKIMKKIQFQISLMYHKNIYIYIFIYLFYKLCIC